LHYAQTVREVINALKLRRLGGGQEEVSVVVDGRRAPKFVIYPDAHKTYPKEAELLSYIERSATSLLSMRATGELRLK
jgi:hypothetical protein